MNIGCKNLLKKRPHGSPRRKTEDNIKMYLQEMKCEFVD